MSRKAISELCVPKGQYCYTLNQRYGRVEVFVGPHSDQTDGNSAPVVWDPGKGKLVGTMLQMALKPAIVVPVGHYAVIRNPYYVDGKLTWPRPGGKSDDVDLAMGTQAVIEGPTSLVPWPGQEVEVQPVHNVLANQYLVVQSITTGEHWVVEGPTRYVPTDDAKVVWPEGATDPVRQAVTLSATQWCRTSGPTGRLRYHQGPGAVIPGPGEDFDSFVFNPAVKRSASVVHEAVDLREQGVAVEVVDNNRRDFGARLFYPYNTEDQDDPPCLYFPRVDERIHAVVDPVELAPGEVRYFIKRQGGDIIRYTGPYSNVFNPWAGELHQHPTHPAGVLWVDPDKAVEIKRAEDHGVTRTEQLQGPVTIDLGYYDRVGRIVPVNPMPISVQADGMTREMVEVNYCVTVLARVAATHWFDDVAGPVQRAVTAAVARYLRSITITDVMEDAGDHARVTDAVASAIPSELVDSFEVVVDSLSVLDAALYNQVRDNQHARVTKALEVDALGVAAESEQALADLRQKVAAVTADMEAQRERFAIELTRLKAEHDLEREQIAKQREELVNQRHREAEEMRRELDRASVEVENARLHGQADAQAKLLRAITPQLSAALEVHGKSQAFKDVLKNLGPAALARDIPIMEFANKLLAGSAMEEMVKPVRMDNGA
jgi:hypothetical protein